MELRPPAILEILETAATIAAALETAITLVTLAPLAAHLKAVPGGEEAEEVGVETRHRLHRRCRRHRLRFPLLHREEHDRLQRLQIK